MRPTYSKGVRHLLSDAHLAAGRFRHRHIHTEHLLLGLLQERNSATRILKRLGFDREELRRACEAKCERGDHVVGSDKLMASIQRMTPRVQHVMAIAGEEMEKLGHAELDSRHVLLGLLQEDNGIAGDILRDAGLTADAVREMIVAEENGEDVPDIHNVVKVKHAPMRRPFWKMWGPA